LLTLDDPTAGRVSAYVDRMKSGNLGHSRSVGDGISDLKIGFGLGYRVYYVRDGQTMGVLLCGGHKGSQRFKRTAVPSA